ncbi:hypothetical protein CO2235_MP20170 [Cupriavidus oxalaticus]|uniref:Uncharacterized protein n=1 Tax=Cupriavidus oxalaticus TaxID=96344 RepID=A0A375FXP7_9BURK|nr:hypothetical protein CO2235_U990006 [Cupriavidus oxalaticus]SPC19759.1 hypothetical protein CO2235_MP20170 [Cupriavidus oxalaticus]
MICFSAATILNSGVTSLKLPEPGASAAFAEPGMAHSGEFLKDYDKPVIPTLPRPNSARLQSTQPAHKMNLSRFRSENLSGSGSGQPSSHRQVPSRRTGLPGHGSMGVTHAVRHQWWLPSCTALHTQSVPLSAPE